MPEHRREVAARDLADRVAVDEHGAVGSRRPPAFGGDADEVAVRRPARARRSSASRPRNSGLSQATTQPRPACSGVMPGPSSWPCSGSPASRRSVSRAPSPAGCDAGSDDRRPQVGGGGGGHGDLDAALARVAGAGDRARRRRPTSTCADPEPARPRRPPGTRRPAARSAPGPCTASTARSCGRVVAADRVAHAVGVGGVGHHVEHVGAVVVPGCHHTMMSSSTEPSSRRGGACTAPARARSWRGRWSAALQPLERAGAGDPHRAEVGHVEHHGVARGRRGARRSCRSGTRAACPSRRTAPSGRRRRGGRRRAASARARSFMWHDGAPAAASARRGRRRPAGRAGRRCRP